jgi:type I restriction enzyme S subunit
MLLPPLSEQKRIVARIEELMTITDKFEKAKIELDQLESELQPQLKKSILQYAIQGKLVPQDSNDEPASILLERIREEKARLVKEKKIKKDKNESIIYKGEDNSYYEKIGKSVVDITDDLPFEIPTSWQWCRLSNIANLYTGNSINESEKKLRYTDVIGTEYIATKDVGFDNSIDYKNGISIPKEYIENFRIAPTNSVLMCIEGGSAGRKIGILSQNIKI